MGQILKPLGGPADAGRALPGFRWTLIPFGDAARPSDPSLALLGFRTLLGDCCADPRRAALGVPCKSLVSIASLREAMEAGAVRQQQGGGLQCFALAQPAQKCTPSRQAASDPA